jgi:hypothetical protein
VSKSIFIFLFKLEKKMFGTPPKVNSWSDRRIKKKADEWLANERFTRETMGDEPDQVAGWTDEQIQFQNEVTYGFKSPRYREVHQHGKTKSQGAKATMDARHWEHTLQDSEWWAEVDKMGSQEAAHLLDFAHAATDKQREAEAQPEAEPEIDAIVRREEQAAEREKQRRAAAKAEQKAFDEEQERQRQEADAQARFDRLEAEAEERKATQQLINANSLAKDGKAGKGWREKHMYGKMSAGKSDLKRGKENFAMTQWEHTLDDQYWAKVDEEAGQARFDRLKKEAEERAGQARFDRLKAEAEAKVANRRPKEGKTGKRWTETHEHGKRKPQGPKGDRMDKLIDLWVYDKDHKLGDWAEKVEEEWHIVHESSSPTVSPPYHRRLAGDELIDRTRADEAVWYAPPAHRYRRDVLGGVPNLQRFKVGGAPVPLFGDSFPRVRVGGELGEFGLIPWYQWEAFMNQLGPRGMAGPKTADGVPILYEPQLSTKRYELPDFFVIEKGVEVALLSFTSLRPSGALEFPPTGLLFHE